MSEQVTFTLRGRNPDVLTCIANLSNDEVFTPPDFANRMLDKLAEAWAADHGGADLWADKTVRFLDPCTKSGVFLREITSRMTKGLEREIPNLEKRVNHILTKQVFGIGITHLTSLLARRSVYCSKHANGKHSIAKGFGSDAEYPKLNFPNASGPVSPVSMKWRRAIRPFRWTCWSVPCLCSWPVRPTWPRPFGVKAGRAAMPPRKQVKTTMPSASTARSSIGMPTILLSYTSVA